MRPRTRVDPHRVEGDARRAVGRGVHARRLAVRAQARRLPAASRAKSHGEALLLTRNGNDYTAVFPEIARAVEALPFDELHHRRRGRRARRAGQAELRAAAAARPPRVADRRASARRSSCRRRSSRSTSSRSRTSTCARCRSRSARRSCSRRSPSSAPCARSITSSARAKRFLEQVSALGLEGIIAKSADAPYRGGRTRCLAQDQGGADRRLRDRRLHRAEGKPRPLRRAAARGHGERHARLRGPRRHRVR